MKYWRAADGLAKNPFFRGSAGTEPGEDLTGTPAGRTDGPSASAPGLLDAAPQALASLIGRFAEESDADSFQFVSADARPSWKDSGAAGNGNGKGGKPAKGDNTTPSDPVISEPTPSEPVVTEPTSGSGPSSGGTETNDGSTAPNGYISGLDTPNGFNIELIFNGSGWTTQTRAGAISVSEMLSDHILGDLAAYNGIDDVRIQLNMENIDGAGGTFGQGGWIQLRSDGMVAEGGVRIDPNDVATALNYGVFETLLAHEMLHAMGFGTTWSRSGLVESFSGDLRFTGANAIDAYNRLYPTIAANDPLSAFGVPVETDGGSGAVGKHWDEGTFDKVLMTTSLDRGEKLDGMTLAALEDMGFDTIYGNDPFAMV